MEVSDLVLSQNLDWDPTYLSDLVTPDFYDFTDHWNMSNVADKVLVEEVDKYEKYCPTVKHISMDDVELCCAVEKIESE